MRRRPAALAALALALAPAAGAAHEVLHEVERGRAVAVRAFHPDGEPLASVAWEAYSPADRRVPHQKGRTDRAGWLAFVPDAPGAWRVRVLEEDGHGLDVTVEVAAPAPGAPAAAEGARPAGGAGFVLRPLVGVAAVAIVFAALAAFHRRGRAR